MFGEGIGVGGFGGFAVGRKGTGGNGMGWDGMGWRRGVGFGGGDRGGVLVLGGSGGLFFFFLSLLLDDEGDNVLDHRSYSRMRLADMAGRVRRSSRSTVNRASMAAGEVVPCVWIG